MVISKQHRSAEQLEPRVLFSSAAPLAPAVDSSNPITATFVNFSAKPVIGGTKGHLTVKLTASASVHATVPISFVLSTDDALDDQVSTLGSISRSVNLKANHSISLPFNFAYPSTLTNGGYFIVADVGPSATGESDNIAATAAAVNITQPFVDLKALGFVNFKTTEKAKHNFNLSAQFQNIGNITDRETVTVQVYDSPDGTFDSSTDTLYGSVDRKLVIPPNAKREVPGFIELPAGTYYLVMQVLSGNDSNSSNNVFIAPQLTVS